MQTHEDIWRRFDYRAIALYTGNPDRGRKIKDELSRVELTDVVPFINAPTPYLKTLEGAVCRTKRNTGNWFAVTLKHQQMVRAAFDGGANFGLFMEDDIRFLKNIDSLSQALAVIPSDADIVLLDWFPLNHASQELEAYANEGLWWIPFHEDLRSCACYALSRKGMQAYLKCLEEPASGCSRLMVCDQYWKILSGTGTYKCYCANPCCCVQGYGSGTSNEQEMWRKYTACGVKRENYA